MPLDYTAGDTGQVDLRGRPSSSPIPLPMADLLAEAQLPSPWDGLSGQPDFDRLMARTIDDLGPADRMMACKRIDEATPQERSVLEAIAFYGWTTWVSFERLAQDCNLRVQSLSRILRSLIKKMIIRQTRVNLSNGRRLRLLTISGHYLLLGYRRRLSKPALNDSLSAQLPDTQDSLVAPQPALNDSLSAQLPDTQDSLVAPQPALNDSLSAQLPDTQDSLVAPQPALNDSLSAQLPALNDSLSNVQNRPTRTLVSSYTDLESFSEQLTNHVPGDRFSSALNDSLSAPSWWNRFVGHVAEIPRPRPTVPEWPAWARLVDLELDPQLDGLREACARFLDTYSAPKHSAVRSLRAVIRAIYGVVLEEWSGGSAYGDAVGAWFSDTPEESAPPVPWEGEADPEARRIWLLALEDLQSQLPRPTYETWLKPTQGVAQDELTFTVLVPTPFDVEWLERRMYQALQKSLEQVIGRPLELVLRIRSGGSYSVQDTIGG